jgi:hypothetical protein
MVRAAGASPAIGPTHGRSTTPADASPERFTCSDPACRRVLARLRWTRRWMKHNGLPLVLEGAKVQQAARTDVRRTWKRHGWRPLSLTERRRRLRAGSC